MRRYEDKPAYRLLLQSVYRLVVVRLIMRFTYIVDEKVSGRYGIIKKDYKVAVAGTGARDIIRGCHNRDKGTAENERLRNPKFIFSYPKNERLIFLGGRNAAQEEISTVRVG